MNHKPVSIKGLYPDVMVGLECGIRATVSCGVRDGARQGIRDTVRSGVRGGVGVDDFGRNVGLVVRVEVRSAIKEFES